MATRLGNQSQVKDKLLVAAIDFGTTYSGYAFSFRHDFETDPLKISNNTSWVGGGGQGLISWKTPTTVLLAPDQAFHSFGYQAEDKYIDLADEGSHKDWYYFRRFKMLLHDKLDLRRDILIADATGKEMPAKTIFAMAIGYLKDHLLNMIHCRGIEFHDDEVMWVLTLPAIWNEPAKQFMREAAVQAGIESHQLKLALEPEAASVYCKTVPLERREDDAHGHALGPFSESTRYLVLDIGGGTVDVTAHEVKSDGTLRELHKASGGAWGGTKVDAMYFDHLALVLGQEVVETFKSDHKYEYLEMQREFESKKRNLREDCDAINIHISAALVECAKEITKKTVPVLIEEAGMAEKMKFRRDRIQFKLDLMKDMFRPSINSIIDHVKKVITFPNVGRVDKILMVGGFSESSLIRQAVKDAFTDVVVVAPGEPGLAVVKGAVIFGHSPNVISTRVSRYTYGVATQGNFIKGYHPEEKKVVVRSAVYCKDLFSKLISMEAEADMTRDIVKEYDISDQRAGLEIVIYATEKEYPIYVTEPGSIKLGRIVIHPPLGGWRKNARVRVAIGFGGTEFTVTATELQTQIEHEAKFDFLS